MTLTIPQAQFTARLMGNIGALPNDKATGIYNHYLKAIAKGMTVNQALDRCLRDMNGDNYHPTKPQRSGFNNKPEA
jgi:hypothetical protein